MATGVAICKENWALQVAQTLNLHDTVDNFFCVINITPISKLDIKQHRSLRAKVESYTVANSDVSSWNSSNSPSVYYMLKANRRVVIPTGGKRRSAQHAVLDNTTQIVDVHHAHCAGYLTGCTHSWE